MDKRFGTGLLVGLLCLVMAAVTSQQSLQQLNILSADRAASTVITQDGTNLDVSTGIDAGGDVTVPVGETVGYSTAYTRYSNNLLLSYIGGVQTLNLGSNYFTPNATNAVYLGLDANRWKTIYGVTGNFSGGISATTGTFTGDVNIGPYSALLSLSGTDTRGSVKIASPCYASTAMARHISVGNNLYLTPGVSTGTHPFYTVGSNAIGGSAILMSAPTGNSGEIIFVRANDADADTWTVSESMRIGPTGNVGIGTTTLTEKLNVAGNISMSTGTNFILPGGMKDYGMCSLAPSSPATGDRYTSTAGVVYVYADASWKRASTGATYQQTYMAATDEIYRAARNVNISATGAITLAQDATHEVIDTAGAVDGDVLTVINVGAYNITLPCFGGATLYSKVIAQGGGASIVLAGSTYVHDGVTFRYVLALGRWVQIG